MPLWYLRLLFTCSILVFHSAPRVIQSREQSARNPLWDILKCKEIAWLGGRVTQSKPSQTRIWDVFGGYQIPEVTGTQNMFLNACLSETHFTGGELASTGHVPSPKVICTAFSCPKPHRLHLLRVFAMSWTLGVILPSPGVVCTWSNWNHLGPGILPHLAAFIDISPEASNQANASPVRTECFLETVLYIICNMINPHKSQLVTRGPMG